MTRIKAVFSEEIEPGLLLTNDPYYGNQYFVNDDLILEQIGTLDHTDFDEGKKFYVIGHMATSKIHPIKQEGNFIKNGHAILKEYEFID